MFHNPNVYGYYWTSFFVATNIWGLACMFIRNAKKGEYPLNTLKTVTRWWSAYTVLFVALSPLFTGISWIWSVLFILAFLLLGQVVRRIHAPERHEFHQLHNAVSFFSWAAAFFALGRITSYSVWYIGASVLLATSIWNVYSEYFIKEAIHQFYSDVDEKTLWEGPLLPEEIPNILTLLTAALFYPLSIGPKGIEFLHAHLEIAIGLALLLGLAVINSALQVAVADSNEQKRLATARILKGVGILIGLLIITLIIGYFTPFHADDFRPESILPTTSSHADPNESPRSLFGVCLWTFAITLIIGILSALYAAFRVLLKPPEYDVFISFSTKDRSEAKFIVRLIEDRGLSNFFSDESLHPGDDFPEQIMKAIRNSAEMAVLCSPNSIRRDYVVTEYTSAHAFGKRIVPILLNLRIEDLPDILIRLNLNAVEYSRVYEYVEDLKRRSRRHKVLRPRRGRE